jgi:hypothetical protein
MLRVFCPTVIARLVAPNEPVLGDAQSLMDIPTSDWRCVAQGRRRKEADSSSRAAKRKLSDKLPARDFHVEYPRPRYR